MSIDAEAPVNDQTAVLVELKVLLREIIQHRLCPNMAEDANVALRALERSDWQRASNYIYYATVVDPACAEGIDSDRARFQHASRLTTLHGRFTKLFHVQ